MFSSAQIHGAGIGLRSAHISQILTEKPPLNWVELLADNHVATGGLVPAHINAVRELYPITLHCVSMSLGAVEPLDHNYLSAIKCIADDFEVSWISDHICFTSASGKQAHDLLPLPYTEEALDNLINRVIVVQEFFGRQILLENATSYIQFNHSTLSEAEFINELVKRADCKLLLDVNNLYVNQCNHGIDASKLLELLPLEQVQEIHLAGFEDRGDFLLDAHNNKVSMPVWELYKELQAKIPGTPTQIEWDNDLPALEVLMAEAEKAQNIMDNAVNKPINKAAQIAAEPKS